MPVLSDQPQRLLPGSRTSQLILGGILLLALGIFIHNRRKRSQVTRTSPTETPISEISEKGSKENVSRALNILVPEVPISSTSTSTITSTSPNPEQEPIPHSATTPMQLPSPTSSLFEYSNSPLSLSPTQMSPTQFSPQNYPLSHPSNSLPIMTNHSSSTFDNSLDFPPRRRSYTKPMSTGGEVNGEIMLGEGWRRHTRVFGGGVCKACEESEIERRVRGL